MADIRILGLDDDNHSPMFVDENRRVYYDAQELIEMLCVPHKHNYEVKMFSLVDEYSDELNQFDEIKIDNMFDFLCGRTASIEGMEFNEIFDMFWKSANRRCW